MKTKLTHIFAEASGIKVAYNREKNAEVDSRHVAVKSDEEDGINFSYTYEKRKEKKKEKQENVVPVIKTPIGTIINTNHIPDILIKAFAAIFFPIALAFIINEFILLGFIPLLLLGILFQEDSWNKIQVKYKYEKVNATITSKRISKFEGRQQYLLFLKYGDVEGVDNSEYLFNLHNVGDKIETTLVSRYDYEGRLEDRYLQDW